jgi:hypothetical protein
MLEGCIMWEKIISVVNKDGHLPIGILIFLIGSAIHWLHGLDASYVAFTTTVLGFLGGHSWVKSQSNDQGQNGGNNDGTK